MDTDSLPSAPVFIAFLFLFSYLALAERSGANGSFSPREGRLSRRFPFVLVLLKRICVIAVSLSGLAWASSVAGTAGLTLAGIAATLLAALLAAERGAALAVAKRPLLAARLARPLTRVLFRAPERRVVNGRTATNGVEPSADGVDEERLPETLADREGPPITEEELISLDQRNREMLRSILQLDISTVREIMVPRLDIVAVPSNSSLDEVVGRMIQSGHSRLPVYEDTIDRVAGIVHVRDLLELTSQQRDPNSWRELVRPAFFVPESKRLDDLLEELQEKGLQLAMVVDEYGGTEGLVTMEDLLEEIVGEIEDEFSLSQEPQVVHLPDGAALVDAGVPTDDVEELFDTRIESPDVDTVGGYVYRTLGKIPQQGDFVVTDHLRIEVVSILGRRLRKLRIDRVKEDAPSPTE